MAAIGKQAWFALMNLKTRTAAFRSPGRTRPRLRFLSPYDQINNLFHLRRDHVSASEYRAARARAFEVWADLSSIAAAA
jgi:putative transposase